MSFNRTLIIVLAIFHFCLGIMLFFNPEGILVYIKGGVTTFPKTICQFTGLSNIMLGLFVYESIRNNNNLLRPIIYLLLFGIGGVYLMFTLKANVFLSVSIYTWRFVSLALLVVALINELYLKRGKGEDKH
jgi:hypothetical protein